MAASRDPRSGRRSAPKWNPLSRARIDVAVTTKKAATSLQIVGRVSLPAVLTARSNLIARVLLRSWRQSPRHERDFEDEYPTGRRVSRDSAVRDRLCSCLDH